MKRIAVLLTLGILLIIPLFVTNPYNLHSVIMVLLFAYLATAWNLVGGYAGQLSLGHSAFLAIGAYTSTILYIEAGISPWFGMIVGGIIAAIVAVLIGLPSFRLKGAYYALATLAFAEGFRRLLESTSHVGSWKLGGAEGLSVPLVMETTFWDFQYLSKVPYYYIILAFLVLIMVITWKLENSKLGYYLTAVREDEEAAKALGINTRRVKLITAGLSAFMTAIGGTLMAQLIKFLVPHSIAGFGFSAEMVFLAIVGGLGTVFGPLVGAVILVTVGEHARAAFGDFIPGFHLVLYGLAVIFVIRFYPKGIFVSVRDYLDEKFKKKDSNPNTNRSIKKSA
jgi:branched-chain amino acid transport system permease protein